MKRVYLECFRFQIHQKKNEGTLLLLNYCYITEPEPQELMINASVMNIYERGTGSFWTSQ